MPSSPFTTRREAQWIASLFGIIMGSVLLCNFNRCCYITASVLYSVAALFDLIAAILWWVQHYSCFAPDTALC